MKFSRKALHFLLNRIVLVIFQAIAVFYCILSILNISVLNIHIIRIFFFFDYLEKNNLKLYIHVIIIHIIIPILKYFRTLGKFMLVLYYDGWTISFLNSRVSFILLIGMISKF